MKISVKYFFVLSVMFFSIVIQAKSLKDYIEEELLNQI